MNYYLIQFHYYPYDDNEVCGVADSDAEQILENTFLMWQHSYTFPDGSCYKLVKTTLSKKSIREIVFPELKKFADGNSPLLPLLDISETTANRWRD